jgi:hypothetical protein
MEKSRVGGDVSGMGNRRGGARRSAVQGHVIGAARPAWVGAALGAV